MGSNDPTVYTGQSATPDAGSGLYNYPFTGTSAAGNANLLIYTGRLLPGNHPGPGSWTVPTPAVGGGHPGPGSWTVPTPGTPGHYEQRVNPQENMLSGFDWFGAGRQDVYVPGTPGGSRQVPAGNAGNAGGSRQLPTGRPADAPGYEQVSLDQFVAQFANQSSDQIQALQTRLVAANALSPNAYVKGLFDQATARAVYNVALAVSSRNDPLFTFDVAVNQAIKYNAQQNAANTTTTTNFDVSSPDQAKGFLLSQMQQMLGRDPTPQEYSAFVGNLNAYEKAHPQIVSTTSTSQIDPTTGGATVKSRTATGGVTDAQRTNQALQATQGAPDYHAVQALNFLGALEELAHAPNDVGTNTAGV